MRKSHAKHAFTSVLRPAYTLLAAASHAARVRGAKKAVLVLVLLFAVSAPAVAGTRGSRGMRAVDRGVVVRVRPAAIVLQELDGSRARIRVSAATIVVLDGRRSTLLALRRGDVAFVVHIGRRPALRIRAFSQ